MERTWIATAALAAALVPAVALAQSTSKASPAATKVVITTTSTGEVSAPGNEMTAAMLKAQNDPKLIGSPAWWKTHSTADGKPLSAAPRSYD